MKPPQRVKDFSKEREFYKMTDRIDEIVQLIKKEAEEKKTTVLHIFFDKIYLKLFEKK